MNGSCQVPEGVNVNFKFSIGIIVSDDPKSIVYEMQVLS